MKFRPGDFVIVIMNSVIWKTKDINNKENLKDVDTFSFIPSILTTEDCLNFSK